ncbi:cobalt-precorrin-6A reductase [Nocardioides sp.]|uniref:cobalt-precorrin-6A reductase n=1 Tax=Nocardioides sp. TaxID=35761 RepID=UPI0027343A9C|nr:cobalt-precorrin-6A reductase [Nocardioides sp.]MDP3892836.1 cobalt-precorrin-6A reductase [Nocardioides sp.]
MRLLLLGGTAEARELAAAGVAAGHQVTSSLAGRVADPLLPVGEVRVGGFGGVAGLVEHLEGGGYDAVVDATHPFAATMTDHAARACASAGVPHLVLRRPGWPLDPAYELVADHAAAARAVSGRVFLTIGRQEVAAYAGSEAWFLIRAIEPPPGPVPGHHELLLARGPFGLEDELALMRDRSIEVLVTKDSGSPATEAKLEAARMLGVRVVMIARPRLPVGVEAVETVDAALDWLARHSG